MCGVQEVSLGSDSGCMSHVYILKSLTFLISKKWVIIFYSVIKINPDSIKHASLTCSIQFSHSVMSDSLWFHELQHTSAPCPTLTPGVYPNSCPLRWWCHPTISILCRPILRLPSILPSIRVFSNESAPRIRWPKYWSFSFSIIPSKNTQGWSPSEWTGWISLQSKGLSRVFSNTTVQKHQFFGTQLSIQSNSHIHTWPLEKL